MSREFTRKEVAQHNKEDDCWIIVDDEVFDMTKFLADHPGGKKVVLNVAGQDASKEFAAMHKPDVLDKYGDALYVGVVAGSKKAKRQQKTASPPATSAQPAAASAPAVGSSSDSHEHDAHAAKRALVQPSGVFGDMVPFGDPAWYQDWYSPYYNDSHRRFRAALREFVQKEIMPHCFEWDEAKKVPRELYMKCAQSGWLAGVVGPPWRTEYVGPNIAGGVKPEEFDAFHELILIDEVARCGSGGVLWALFAGLSIGLPPILHYGSQQLRDKVAPGCLKGEKIICLAITEPYAGSDVASIRCEAKKTADGQHYIVNGEKKWITNGVWADFFTVAVRTGGPGMGGISMLLIERSTPGIVTRQMNCSGVWASGTTFISFEDVKVPVSNLIGKENEGFRYIMANFNHERWGIVVQATRFARVCLEEALRHAHKRKTFGQRLIDHPVIRNKVAHMARHVEATSSWLENVTYQLTLMSHKEQVANLGGPIALLKAQSTQTFELCAREAAQIFGGLSYTRGGQGEKVERLYREVRAYAIPGGSEEIMLDLGVRQALKRKDGAKL